MEKIFFIELCAEICFPASELLVGGAIFLGYGEEFRKIREGGGVFFSYLAKGTDYSGYTLIF